MTTQRIKYLSLFSGIGAFETALERLGVQFDLIGYSEIDKYASRAYSILHNVSEDKNLGDVRNIETVAVKGLDLITYGFPCQDLSNAGAHRGFVDEMGNTTRSGLFFQALRLIEELKPKVCIAENVKALAGKRWGNEFKTVLTSLSNAGYNNYWKVLSAANYGVPQKRERVFIVSIRKDIDNGSFTFPTPIPLTLKMRDCLDESVPDKYYLSNALYEFLSTCKDNPRRAGLGFKYIPVERERADIANTITTKVNRVESNYIIEGCNNEL